MRRNAEAGRFDRQSSPPRLTGRGSVDEGGPGHGGSRFERMEDFRGGGVAGGRGGGFYRVAPPDDFRREPWSGGGRGGPLDRDEYGRVGGGRFRESVSGIGRGVGRGGREECLSRSDLAAERARVSCLCSIHHHHNALHSSPRSRTSNSHSALKFCPHSLVLPTTLIHLSAILIHLFSASLHPDLLLPHPAKLSCRRGYHHQNRVAAVREDVVTGLMAQEDVEAGINQALVREASLRMPQVEVIRRY